MDALDMRVTLSTMGGFSVGVCERNRKLEGGMTEEDKN